MRFGLILVTVFLLVAGGVFVQFSRAPSLVDAEVVAQNPADRLATGEVISGAPEKNDVSTSAEISNAERVPTESAGNRTFADSDAQISNGIVVGNSNSIESRQSGVPKLNTDLVSANNELLRDDRPSSSDTARNNSADDQVDKDADESDDQRDDEILDEDLGLAIAGRVLDTSGQMLPGFRIRAQLLGNAANASTAREIAEAVSDGLGQYTLTGLQDGLYRVSTEAKDNYRAIQLTIKAGLKSADIILTNLTTVVVKGSLTSTTGNELAEAKINVLSAPSKIKYEEFGEYEIKMDVRPNNQYIVNYTAPGYITQTIRFRGEQLATEQTTTKNVQLEPAVETTSINVTVYSDEGSPLKGQHVRLYSSNGNANKTAFTNDDGIAEILQIGYAPDYTLTVRSNGQFKEYRQSSLAIVAGTPDINVVLEAIETGSVSGELVDQAGSLMPDFELWLLSESAPSSRRPIRTDQAGRFALENVPTGRLTFTSLSQPNFNITGYSLTPGDVLDVTIQVDWGDQGVTGQVFGPDGNTIAGASVSIGWRLQRGDITSRATRSTVTQEDGSFRFSQLGRGNHELRVLSPKLKPFVENLNLQVGEATLQVILQAG